MRSSSSPAFFISWNIVSWSTLSNADFRSMNSIHNLPPSLFSYFILIYSIILIIFISQPNPSLNPIWFLSSLNYPFLFFSSSYNLVFNIVSSSLYIGEVLVIGLALLKFLYPVLSFGIYIYSSKFYLKGSLSSFNKIWFKYIVMFFAILSSACFSHLCILFYCVLSVMLFTGSIYSFVLFFYIFIYYW